MNKPKDQVSLYINICLDQQIGKSNFKISAKPKGSISVGPLKHNDPALFTMPEKVVDEAWAWLHDSPSKK